MSVMWNRYDSVFLLSGSILQDSGPGPNRRVLDSGVHGGVARIRRVK